MTDSDSLRGDPNYDPTRRTHPEIRELDELRELLRPRMAATGDASSTEALHGLITELEATSGLVGRAVEHWAPTFRARLCELLCSTQGGHGGGTMQELFDELVSVVKDMNKDVLAERQIARAVAEAHDHARATILAIAEVFNTNDLDSLPVKVRELEAQRDAVARNEAHTFQRLTTITAQFEEMGVALDDTVITAKTRAALSYLGWDGKSDVMVWARSSANPVAAARWTKICEAFGFDPEQDPPVSIPAILAGDRWTNTRRMLADACKRAPSLEIVLGGLVQALSEARQAARALGHGQTVCTSCARRIAQGEARQPVQGCGDCWWLEFGDAPLAGFRWADPEPCATALPAAEQAPIEAPCPRLDEPCHVRKSTEADRRYVASQVWIIEPMSLPGYVISGHSASWAWTANLGGIEYALAGYGSATAAIAGAREHVAQMAGQTAPGRARCPVCHRMAPVKHGGFQEHLSGDRVCAGTNMLSSNLLSNIRKILRIPDGASTIAHVEAAAHAAEQTASFQKKLDAAMEELEAVRFALDETAGWARTRRTALRILGWDETADPETWATARAADFDSFSTTVRAALDIPTNKPLLPYIRHAAVGMKALAILGWQDGHPVEWATARAAAEADLRGAFAEAELMGSDYAAMVRQMWGNLRSKAEQATSALAQLKHLSSTVDLAEKRLSTWRSWVIGMCPATPAFSSPMDNMSDDGLRAAMNYVPASALDSAQGKLKAALDGLNRAIALLSK